MWDSINTFLQSKDYVLVLLGDSGVGKTLTTYQLAENLLAKWREFFQKIHSHSSDLKKIQLPTYYFPVLLRPSLKEWNHDEIKGGFLKSLRFYGLEKMIDKIKFLIIVDGYDECTVLKSDSMVLGNNSKSTFTNICETLGIKDSLALSSTSPSFKLVISCRPETVKHADLASTFSFSGNFQVFHFLSFNLEQMTEYPSLQLGWDEEVHSYYKNKIHEQKCM